GVRDIFPHACQGEQVFLGARHVPTVALCQFSAQHGQPLAPMPEAERSKQLDHLARMSGGERNGIRVAGYETLVSRNYEIGAGPLQHDLCDKNGVRLAAFSPGKPPSLAVEPGKYPLA